MRRLLPHLLALVLGVTAAVAIGCGGSNAHLIPADDAGRLKDQLAGIRDAVNSGDCPRAEAAVAQAIASARLLPPTVDRRLRQRINQGLRALRDRVPVDCRRAQTQTVTVPTVTTPATTSTPTTTTPTTTTPTTTTPPATPTDTTPAQTETTPSGSGGTGAPQP